MSRRASATLVAVFLGMASFNGAFARDGVLPLRGDGVLPLRLRGEAMTLTNPTLPPARLNAEIMLISATQQSMTSQQGAALTCQQPESVVTKHAAGGTVTIGGVRFAIKGICYNADNRNMEVVSEYRATPQTVDRSFMIGLLPNDAPSQFSGRLFINGSSSYAGRYSFNVSRQQPH